MKKYVYLALVCLFSSNLVASSQTSQIAQPGFFVTDFERYQKEQRVTNVTPQTLLNYCDLCSSDSNAEYITAAIQYIRDEAEERDSQKIIRETEVRNIMHNAYIKNHGLWLPGGSASILNRNVSFVQYFPKQTDKRTKELQEQAALQRAGKQEKKDDRNIDDLIAGIEAAGVTFKKNKSKKK